MAALPNLAGEPIWVDGKAVRGSSDGANPAVHLVSAFASRARWALAQSRDIGAEGHLETTVLFERVSIAIARIGKNQPLQPDAHHRVGAEPERAAIRFQRLAIARQLHLRLPQSVGHRR